MESIGIFYSHLRLLDNILYSSVEEKPGFLIAKSFLNDNWYDSITITDPKLLDWNQIRDSAVELTSKGIDYALYFPTSFIPEIKEIAEKEGFKRVGGDAYMSLGDIVSFEPQELSKEMDILQVNVDNFPIYKELIEEIHGNDMGWPAAGKFADVMFSASQKEIREKSVGLYLAYYNGVAVGYSSNITSQKLSLTYLTASGVKGDFRGKGIYSAMVSQRLASARAEGIKSAYVITGQESKSWHAAKKFGYEEIGRFEYYLRRN